MMHKSRAHSLTTIATLDDLTEKLTDHTWTTCTGFAWRSLVILNDSTGPDGAQEYAIVKGGVQVESLTVSWMKRERLAEILTRLDAEEPTDTYGRVEVRPHPKGSCAACM